MKKNIIIFTIILFSFFTSMLIVNNSLERKRLTTDSGFDADYGGGSSDSGFSSSSSSSRSGKKISDLSPEEIAILIIIISAVGTMSIVSLVVVLQDKEGNQIEIMDEDKIKKLIKEKNIDEDKLINDAFDIYNKVQIAWMNDTLNDVKDIISDELYNQYDAQLSTLRIKKQQNIMSDIEFVKGYIININDYDDYYTVSIVLVVLCKDYIINKETKEVLRGSESRINKYNYTLGFLCNKKEDHCPNCGALLEEGGGVTCPSCKSEVVLNNGKMIMISKKMNYQTVVNE